MFDKLLRFGLPAVAALLLLFAVYYVVTAESTEAIERPERRPPTAPFEHTVAGAGIIEAPRENVSVGVFEPGIVTNVPVVEGDVVQPGDPLIQQDSRVLESEVAQRRAEQQVREARLERLRAEPRAERLPAAEARLEAAKARYLRAKDQYARQQEIYQRDAATERSLIEARQSYEVAIADFRQAEADRRLLQAGAWDREIAIAEAELAAAEAGVAAAKARLARREVKSLLAGAVIRVNVQPGEFVAAPSQEPLLVLAAEGPLQVRVNIDEYDIPRFEPGKPAIARLKGRPQTEIPLRFERVEPFVVPKRSLTGETAERVDTRVLQAVYTIDETPENDRVYVGQQVDVFIQAPPPAEATRGSSSSDE